jgi:hypothetical protein
MFVSDKIIFIEVQKTASMHIKKLLSQLLEGEKIKIGLMGKHIPAFPEHFEKNVPFLASVRNPWEWYISLWAFGCGKKGAVYDNAIKAKEHSERWKRCYSDVDSESGFREWLYMLHDEKYWDDIGEEYSSSNINRFAGFYTYRYMKLCCRNTDSTHFQRLASYNELKDFEKSHCYINHFIQTEKLADDLIKALELCGVVISDQEKKMIYATRNSNTSKRKKKADYYYDNGTAKLVADREKLIIEKFGYSPPLI